MALVLPEVGRTSFLSLVLNTTEYAVLGPFAEGAWLRRLWFSMSASGVGAITVGAVLGPSAEATEAAFLAGASLIDTSDMRYGGQPVVVFQVVQGVTPQMVVPCGRRVMEGARYVVVCARVQATPVACTVITGIEVLRVVMGKVDRVG